MRRPAMVSAAFATALVLLAAACSGGTGAGQEPGPGPGRTPTGSVSSVPRAGAPVGHQPDPSAGCRRQAAPPASGRRAFGGRSYLLKRPNNNGRTPAPLVLDLHGLRSTAFAQALYGRMADTGAARGFIVVEPQSAPGRGGWKLPGMPDGSADIRYMDALLDHLERLLCVDVSREYATGLSNGAGLATALICGLDGRLAGVAPVAGLNLARPCSGARPTTIVAFHGTADRIVPYRGGEPFGGDRRQIPAWMRPRDGVYALPAVDDLAADWARSFGCGTGARGPLGRGAARQGIVRRGPEVRRLTYPGCADGVHVELYTVAGGGHTWPGTLPIGGGVGKTTTKIDATKVILDAFTASTGTRR